MKAVAPSSVGIKSRWLDGSHFEWDHVGSLRFQLGSHTYVHAGSSIDAPVCWIPWDPTEIPQDPAHTIDRQSNAHTTRLIRAVQKHWEWDLVGSLRIQLGSHTYVHAGSSIDAPGCTESCSIDPQSNAHTTRLEGAVQKHWEWDLVGFLRIQLGSGHICPCRKQYRCP